MKLERWRAVLMLVALALVASPALFDESADPARAREPALTRLLGPLSELAARVQWVRVQAAMNEGRRELALARAETALGLDPRDTEGWRFTAAYLALDLASPNVEPSPERRRALLRSALELLRRGERSAREPEQLALWQGLVLLTHAEIDPELGWPAGTSGLWREAAAAFEHAAALGSSEAEDLARAAQRRVAEAE